MKQFFVKLGRFLRIVDESAITLSITNIAVYVVLVKIALAAEPSITEMGGLLITLAAYYGKKHINKDKVAITDENKAAIEELKVKVQNVADKASGVAAMVGMRGPQIK